MFCSNNNNCDKTSRCRLCELMTFDQQHKLSGLSVSNILNNNASCNHALISNNNPQLNGVVAQQFSVNQQFNNINNQLVTFQQQAMANAGTFFLPHLRDMMLAAYLLRGYYQPAGPLISAHHAAPAHVVGPPPASVQPGSGGGNTGSGKTAPLPSLEASPTSTPPLPSSVGGESSDNDVTVTTGAASDSSQQPPPQPPQPTATYRYSQSYPPPSGGHAPPGYSPYYPPTQYYASPPSAGSLQYPQQQHYHHQDLCYSTTSYPPATHFYHKAATYGTPPPPGSFTRRYIGPPPHYYTSSNPSDLYASSQNAQQSSQVVTAGSAASTGATYQPPPGGPPPPTLVETYPAPPPGSVSIVDPYPPPPPYYPGYSAGPAPACYTHGHSPPTRSLAFIDTAYQSCPCPMQSCPKNVHTGPLTGDGKRSNMTSIAKETGLSLPPVALALPLEPASVIGPPSPARGSAGMPPPPSPAGATYQQSTTPKWDAKQEEGSNETLISESKTADKVRRKARVGKTMARNSLANNFNNLQKQTNNTMLLMCHNADTNNDISVVKREAVSSDDEVVILEERRKVNISELPLTQVDEKTVPQITQQSEEPKTEDVNERLSPPESESKKDIVLNKTDSNIDNDRTIPAEEKKSDKSDENVITSTEENKEAKPQNGKKRKLTLDDIDEKILEVQKKQKIFKNTSSYKDLIRKNTKIITKLNNGKQKLNVPLETKSRILISKTPKITLSSKSNKKLTVKRTASQCKDEPVAKKVKSSKPLAASSLHNSKQNVKAIKPILDNSKLSENKEPVKKMLNKKNVKKMSNVLNCLSTAKNNVDRTIESVITNSVSIVDNPMRTDITDLLQDSCVKKEEAPKTVLKKDNIKNIVVKKDEVIKVKKENINCIKKDEVLKNLNVKKENLLKCVKNEENLKNMCAKKEKEDILKCNPVKKLEVLKSNSINKKDDLKKLKNTVAIKKDSLKSTIDKKTNSKKLDQNSKSKIGNNKQTKVLAVNKIVNKKKNKIQEVIAAVIPRVPRRSLHAPRWSNGWSWEGEPFEGKVFLNSDEAVVARKCYPAMRHLEGDVVTPRDCVLLKSGPRKIDLPFVAKVAALWENPDDGEMMMSLLWYYRPEHTEQGRLPSDQPDEVFASRHKDTNSVACIEDKCYVLTYSEYCRYRKNMKRLEEGIENPCRIVPVLEGFWRAHRQPPSEQPTSPELVMFCRRVYDFRQKRIVKNPGG